jgi:O-antigen/teichoic acid export membrane protein
MVKEKLTQRFLKWREKGEIAFRSVFSPRFLGLFKEGFWIALGQAMAMLGLLIGVRFLTELLDPAAYGELALGMTVATLVNQVVFGPVSGGVIRFYAPAKERGHFTSYMGAVRSLVWSATAIVVCITLITVVGLYLAGRSEWITMVIWAFVFAILSGCNSILSGLQNAARQRSIVALHQGFEAWARFVVAAGFMLWFGRNSAVAMAGYVVAILLVLGSQYVFFKKIESRDNPFSGEEQNWKSQIWKYSWPISIFGIFTWMQLVSDRWALGQFSTTQEVGLYAVLFQLGYYPMSMLSGMATQLLVPIFFQRAGDATDSSRNANVNSLSWRLTWLTLALTGVVFLLTMFFHGRIFETFVAKQYISVSYLLPWMLLAGGILAAAQTIALNLMSQLKTQLMMTAKIITALLGVAFNCAGAYWYGTVGIVIASILFSVSFFSWMALLSRHSGEKNCL